MQLITVIDYGIDHEIQNQFSVRNRNELLYITNTLYI